MYRNAERDETFRADAIRPYGLGGVFVEKRRTGKPNRLPDYDYSQCGSYSLTLCTHDHKNRFWLSTKSFELSEAGQIVDFAIRQIPQYYPDVVLERYAVMPNHVHILLTLPDSEGKKVSSIIGQMKRWSTKRIGAPLWQKSFYDHVIRDEHDFAVKWNYIDTNPLRWELDDFYYSE